MTTDVDLDLLPEVMLVSFSLERLPPPFVCCMIWEEPIGRRLSFSQLMVEYQHSFEKSSPWGHWLLSVCFFIVTYLYQCGPVTISRLWLILWDSLIMVLKWCHLWPLGALSIGLHACLAYRHNCEHCYLSWQHKTLQAHIEYPLLCLSNTGMFL